MDFQHGSYPSFLITVKVTAAKPEFLIVKIASFEGQTILRNHPITRTITYRIIKGNCQKSWKHNIMTKPMKKVWILLKEGFVKVTNKTCQKLIVKS
jgi:hypothetical protein